jgi:hypothetical protein
MKQAKLQELQNPSEINVHNLNIVKPESSVTFSKQIENL